MSNTRTLASLTATAQRYSVHPRTIRRRIADGTIKGYRVGRSIRVDLDECDGAFLTPIPAAKAG